MDLRKTRARAAALFVHLPSGKPLSRNQLSDAWQPARDALGFEPRVGLHVFRHYFTTELIHAGASVKRVQLALGHSTPTVTLNTYTHERPEAEENTRTIMDRAFGEAPGAYQEASGTTLD